MIKHFRVTLDFYCWDTMGFNMPPLLWGSAEGARQSAVWGDPCATRSGHPESCSDWTRFAAPIYTRNDWPPVYSSVFQYISIYLYIYVSVYLYIYISIYLYIYISIYLYLCISISLSIIYASERFTSWTVFLEGLLHLMFASGLTTFCWLRLFSGQIIYIYIVELPFGSLTIAIEIVSFPIRRWWFSHSYVNWPEGKASILLMKSHTHFPVFRAKPWNEGTNCNASWRLRTVAGAGDSQK